MTLHHDRSDADGAGGELLRAIEDLGFRVTDSRRRVATALASRTGGFTAEDVCAELDDVGRATVYRTLKLFQDAEAICKLSLPDGAPRYAVAQGGRHHHHSVCVVCGAVGEFRDSTVERVLRAVAADVEGEIVGHRMEFYVTCPACLRRE